MYSLVIELMVWPYENILVIEDNFKIKLKDYGLIYFDEELNKVKEIDNYNYMSPELKYHLSLKKT